jgi:membrane-associated protease RseP (regulator of RpoE activity)
MGSTFHATAPGIGVPTDSAPPAYVMPASPRPTPVTRHVVLFILTFISTTLAGGDYYWSYLSELGNTIPTDSQWSLWLHGMTYSCAVLAILGAHEFGHYFACRYYGVDASLPYFIPFWIPFAPLPGTLGAVIRIRQPIASKRQFFDIGIAGPIAGFLVLIPILVIGVALSDVVTVPSALPANVRSTEFGSPLIFSLVTKLFHGTLAPGQSINYHPAAWAAWFGLLATALNLCPVSQLDGGHISYAVFGRRSSTITMIVTAGMIGLALYSGAYLLWTVLVVVMLYAMGRHHPRASDESEPLDPARLWLAAFAVAMLVLSFTPIPLVSG